MRNFVVIFGGIALGIGALLVAVGLFGASTEPAASSGETATPLPAGAYACGDALDLHEEVTDGALTMAEWVALSREINENAKDDPAISDRAAEVLRHAISAHDELDVLAQRSERTNFKLSLWNLVDVDCVNAGYLIVVEE